MRRAGCDRFARRAPAGPADHAVAGCELAHTLTHALDDARKLSGRRERKRRLVLIFAGNDQQVKKIECGRLNVNDGFAGARLRLGNIGEFQIVGRAEMRAQ